MKRGGLSGERERKRESSWEMSMELNKMTKHQRERVESQGRNREGGREREGGVVTGRHDWSS